MLKITKPNNPVQIITEKGVIITVDKNSRFKKEQKQQTHQRLILNQQLKDINEIRVSEKGQGRCMALEKEYFRLTSSADMSTIRPEHILKQSLSYLLKRLKFKQIEYSFFSEQMRSIRQDLTVQNIENEFSAAVYEINARISIDNNDISTFDHSLNMLQALYDNGVESANRCEFYAYYIQYHACLHDTLKIQSILLKLSPSELKDDLLVFSLEVYTNIVTSNYQRLFNIYKTGNIKMTRVLSFFMPELRLRCLSILIRSHINGIPLPSLREVLQFSTEYEVQKFLRAKEIRITHNSVQISDNQHIL